MIDLDDNPEGAAGLAFMVNVIELSESVCAVISGVPDAVKFKLYEPVLTPANECPRVAPIDPGDDPSSVTLSFDDPSFHAYTYESAFCVVLVTVTLLNTVPSYVVSSYTVNALSPDASDTVFEVPDIDALTSGSTCTVKSDVTNGDDVWLDKILKLPV